VTKIPVTSGSKTLRILTSSSRAKGLKI
jgi:hypothetical protein